MAEGIYTVFGLKRFEEKFGYARDVALEISLFADAIVGFIALLLIGVTVAYNARRGKHGTASSIVVAALFGAVYTTLPSVLYWLQIEPAALLWWIWIFFMPLAAALVTVRQMSLSSAERSLVLR